MLLKDSCHASRRLLRFIFRSGRNASYAKDSASVSKNVHAQRTLGVRGIFLKHSLLGASIK
jgi:purine nucleoside phosphorylase